MSLCTRQFLPTSSERFPAGWRCAGIGLRAWFNPQGILKIISNHKVDFYNARGIKCWQYCLLQSVLLQSYYNLQDDYVYLDVSDGIRIGGTAFNIMFPARVSASILDSPQWDTTYWLRHNKTSFDGSKSYVPILNLWRRCRMQSESSTEDGSRWLDLWKKRAFFFEWTKTRVAYYSGKMNAGQPRTLVTILVAEAKRDLWSDERSHEDVM